MGLVFVLLLGEIDLSAGFTAGTAAAVLAVAMASWGMAWPVALVARPAHRHRHRPAHRRPRRPARHPVLRRHAGDVPGPAGRHAPDHRRGRHHPAAQRRAAGHHEQEHAAVGRLAAVGGRHPRVRVLGLAQHRRPPQGGPQGDRDLGLGGQGRRPWPCCSAGSVFLLNQQRQIVRPGKTACLTNDPPDPARLHPGHPGRAVGRARRAGAARRAHLRAQPDIASAATSTRSAATPRRRGARASA